MTVAGVLLAAGRSRRFGPEEKLLAPFRNGPLISHAARALVEARPDHLIAVVNSDAVADCLAGFSTVRPPRAPPEQSSSVIAGVTEAGKLGATGVVIVLGDMPFVTAALIRSVIQHCGAKHPSASTDGKDILPPACFPSGMFGALLSLKGDRGAGSLLSNVPPDALVRTTRNLLVDIDTRTQLDELERRRPRKAGRDIVPPA